MAGRTDRRLKPIHRILGRALQFAAERCRDPAPLEPMLLLDGPKGMAVLRLDFESAEERLRLRAKAGLMATAIAADASACLFGSRLRLRGGLRVPVAVIVADSRTGDAVRIFARHRGRLTPLPGGLAGQRLPGTLAGVLDGLLPAAPSEQASARAWRELEAMGVNIGGNGGRAVH